jgi:hypothetical protein
MNEIPDRRKDFSGLSSDGTTIIMALLQSPATSCVDLEILSCLLSSPPRGEAAASRVNINVEGVMDGAMALIEAFKVQDRSPLNLALHGAYLLLQHKHILPDKADVMGRTPLSYAVELVHSFEPSISTAQEECSQDRFSADFDNQDFNHDTEAQNSADRVQAGKSDCANNPETLKKAEHTIRQLLLPESIEMDEATEVEKQQWKKKEKTRKLRDRQSVAIYVPSYANHVDLPRALCLLASLVWHRRVDPFAVDQDGKTPFSQAKTRLAGWQEEDEPNPAMKAFLQECVEQWEGLKIS